MQGSHDQLNAIQQGNVYCLCWGLEIDIGNILFSSLIAQLNPGKKERRPNICYTRYFSLILKHLLKDSYKNENLKTFKPHHITASSFKPPYAYEVRLTYHMLKVAKLSEDDYKSLFPPSREVNAEDTSDKSLSGTSVHHVSQSRATTNKRLKNNKILYSFDPKRSKYVRVSPQEK
ncbi:hypothetical protein Tco_1016139 [Tanacetum coccineum]|uniref:Uncharacterized protein n=1 Tax=Tanacetum coccineum TaxID=301880 RepID=A0ABQ5FNB9_9ASTR